jgi:hypothetical protein
VVGRVGVPAQNLAPVKEILEGTPNLEAPTLLLTIYHLNCVPKRILNTPQFIFAKNNNQ